MSVGKLLIVVEKKHTLFFLFVHLLELVVHKAIGTNDGDRKNDCEKRYDALSTSSVRGSSPDHQHPVDGDEAQCERRARDKLLCDEQRPVDFIAVQKPLLLKMHSLPMSA